MAPLPPGVIQLGGPGCPPPPPPPPLHPAGARVPNVVPPPPPPPPGRGPPGPFAAKPGPLPPTGRAPMGGPMPLPIARPPMGGPQPPPAGPRPVAQMQPRIIQPMPVQQLPIQPPREKVPLELRQKQLVEVSDLRTERMTESGAREALSEYVVYRFEKIQDPNEIDVEGYPTRPTWENVRRVEVRDLSRQDIIRDIRDLNDEGRTALQRKMELTANQQSQIEKAQDALEKRNTDRRFRYTLQQISCKMKKIHKDSIQYAQYMADKKLVVAKGKSSSKSKKNLFETVAVTAYFKKEPRFEENALAMYHSKKNEEAMIRHRDEEARSHQLEQQMQEEKYRNLLALRQREQQFQAALQPPRAPAPPALLPPQRQHPLLPPPPLGHKPLPPPGHKALPPPTRPGIQVVHTDHKKGKTKTYTLSSGSRSSRDSHSSDESWSDTEFTPDSSTTGSSDSRRGRRHHRSRGRNRSRSHSRNRSHSHRRHRSRPEDHGLKAPRRHRKDEHEQYYILEREVPISRTLGAPMSPVALPMPPVRDFMGEEPFMQRRITARPEPYGLNDDPLNDVFNRRRTTLPARVIQRDVNFRAVGPQEVVRRRHEDDLDNIRRLRLEDEMRLEDERRLEDEWEAERNEMERRNRRSMERRFRRPSLDRGPIFQRGSDETYEEQAARDYMRTRERPARSSFDNPFDPMGRGTRRNAFGFAGYRD